MFSYAAWARLPSTMVVRNRSIFSFSSQFQHRKRSTCNRNHWDVYLYMNTCTKCILQRPDSFDCTRSPPHSVDIWTANRILPEDSPPSTSPSVKKRLFLHRHRKSPTRWWELNSVITAIFQWPNFAHWQRTAEEVETCQSSAGARLTNSTFTFRRVEKKLVFITV